MNEKLVVEKLIQRGETISSMESCTGGYFASTITCVSGSSKVLEFSAVTYSNEYKIKMGVNRTTIDMYSVYSSEVAREMAKCISEFSKSSYGVGITGKINEVDHRRCNCEYFTDCIDGYFCNRLYRFDSSCPDAGRKTERSGCYFRYGGYLLGTE